MVFFIIAITIITGNFFFLRKKLSQKRRNQKHPKTSSASSSLPSQYAYCFVIWGIILTITIFFGIQNSQFLLKIILLLIALGASIFITIKSFQKRFNAKKHLELITKTLLIMSTGCGIIITALIVISIVFEAFRFFQIVNISQFLFGLSWNPQVAVYEGQSLSDSSFGMIPVLTGTLLITVIAISVAVPIGLYAAIYLSNYAKRSSRNILKPALEILAGVPTVVYGYFAVISVAPFLKYFFATTFNMEIAAESALAAGLVMGVMIIPFILSLSDDALTTVPTSLKDGALAMGSTKSEMIKKVVLPAALPSIIGAVLLAISRAIGETMIVTMAAGLVANLTFDPTESVTTATAQIVTLLVGDQESDSPKTLAAFALGLMLFVMTLIFNIIALIVVKKYKEKYE